METFINDNTKCWKHIVGGVDTNQILRPPFGANAELMPELIYHFFCMDYIACVAVMIQLPLLGYSRILELL